MVFSSSSLWNIYVFNNSASCRIWHNTLSAEWTGKQIHRAVLLCAGSRCGGCRGQCSPAQRARVTTPNAGPFLLSGHTVSNLALAASVSSRHAALFIVLIIVRLRHFFFLGSGRGAEPGSETFQWTDEGAVTGWYICYGSASFSSGTGSCVCLCSRIRKYGNTVYMVLLLSLLWFYFFSFIIIFFNY